MGFFGTAPEKPQPKESPAVAPTTTAKESGRDENIIAVLSAAVAACAEDGRIAAIAAAIAACTGGETIACIRKLDGAPSWSGYARIAAVTARKEMF